MRLSQQAVGCQQLGLLTAAFTSAGQGSPSNAPPSDATLWNSIAMLPVAGATLAAKEAAQLFF